MKVRAWLALALILCLTVSLAACGSNDTAVYVQSVSDLTGMGGIAAGDRFPGMVVSENVTEDQEGFGKDRQGSTGQGRRRRQQGRQAVRVRHR